jgi:hypothetical protein
MGPSYCFLQTLSSSGELHLMDSTWALQLIPEIQRLRISGFIKAGKSEDRPISDDNRMLENKEKI